MPYRLRFHFFTVMLCLFSAVATAEISSNTDTNGIAAGESLEAQPLYQVEFIVLRPRVREDLLSEDWLDTHPAPQNKYLTPSATPVLQPLEETPQFSWVDESEWDLPNTLRRLEQSGRYEILMHQSWRQQATPRDNAVAFMTQLAFNDANQPQPRPDEFSHSLVEPLVSTEEKAGVYGKLSFSKARYLHLSVDLLMSEYQLEEAIDNEVVYQQAGFSSGEESSAITSPASLSKQLGLPERVEPRLRYYLLSETRRIKTEETHYFDHPAFSVLAHVRRLAAETSPQP